MFGKATQAQTRPTALGLMLQASTYGQTIPNIFGRTRSPLYIIWSGNLREQSSGKKGKKSGKKGAPPTYAENADFLIGSNPIIAALRLWANKTDKYPLNFIKKVIPYSGGFQKTFPIEISPGVPDPNFYAVVGVTVTVTYTVTFNDYGGQGSQTLTGSMERPLWNTCYNGPDPTDQRINKWLPWVYTWYPGDGPAIICEFAGIVGWWAPVTAINIYYAQITTIKGTVQSPIAAFNMEFESQLGSGSEYTPLPGQRITYPMYAGLGTSDLDLGIGAIPNIRVESIGSFAVYSTGDCDFADIIEFLFKSGESQAAFTADNSQSGVTYGVNASDYPGTIQKTWVTDFAPGQDSWFYDMPNKAGNALVAVLFNTSAGSSISDTGANAWTAAWNQPNFHVWYALPCNASAHRNIVSFSNIGFTTHVEIQLFEIAGLDTVDAVATFTGFTGDTVEGSITTTQDEGEPVYILAVVYDTMQVPPHVGGIVVPPQWKVVIPCGGGDDNQINNGTQYTATFSRVVRSPGTYDFKLKVNQANCDLVLIAFKNSQAVSFPKPFGNLLESSTLDICRMQARAGGLFGSLSMDNQQKAIDWIRQLYVAMNAAPVWSGFQLKSVPYSEVSAVGNGATYTAPTASGPIQDLSTELNDFICDPGAPPITVERIGPTEINNLLKYQHPDRSNDYNVVSTSQPDQGSIAMNGNRKGSPQNMPMIQDVAVARMLLGIAVRRQNYTRNTYKFKLQPKWKLLEAMDLISLTDPLLGLLKQPARLTSVKEAVDRTLDCEAEQFIYGLNAPVLVDVTLNQRNITDTNEAPGVVNAPIFFMATPAMLPLGLFSPPTLCICISGSVPATWGGAVIWVSTDGGTSYHMLTTQVGATAMGVLSANFGSTGDPDTTVDCDVDLTESAGQLNGFTVAEEDQFLSVCFVEGGPSCAPFELISYAVADLTGANQYAIRATGGNKIRRGILDTLISAHVTGQKFAFLGAQGTSSKGGVVGTGDYTQIQVQPSWIGKTLYFKFQGFNIFGAGFESLAACTAYPYTIPVPCPTGLLGSGAPVEVSFGPTTAGNFTLPHGLAARPGVALVRMESAGKVWFQSARYDATNLYLTADDNGLTGKIVCYPNPAGAEVAFSTTGSALLTVPHGLGTVPSMALAQMTSGGALWEQQPLFMDATNVYFVVSDPGSTITGYVEAWVQGPPGNPFDMAFKELPLAPGAAGNFTIPHALGHAPSEVFINMDVAADIWFQSPAWDATNIYLVASDPSATGFAEVLG